MTSSITYRFLLLGLLPLIAVFIYMEGQDYDPALLTFQSSESTENPMASFIPEGIPNFSRIGQIRTYTSENLYEYVNGHAEYFISAGFKGLAVGEYSGVEGGGPDVVVDIYDMGRSIYAFSVLADETDGKADLLLPGVTGLKTEQGVSFFKGQYFVKIALYNKDVSLDDFIIQIDRQIDSSADLFPEFALLPDIGDVVQTRFVREAYRGLDFVNNVIEREYSVGGERLQVFLYAGDEGEIKKLVRSFTDYFSQSEIEYDVIDKMGRVIYKIRDQYEGEWILIPLSDALFGIYGHYNDAIIDSILKGPSE